jgi:serine kinase of HPr protein (carbohydrate metabolism regulator)
MNEFLIYISNQYIDKRKYEEVLKTFDNLFNYVMSHYSQTIVKDLRYMGIKYDLIAKDQLYNFLREETQYVIVFYDFEDKHTEDIIKYCSKHRIPILVVNSAYEGHTYV